ncbi:hypothetical protein [Candidatus Nitrospira allomarina]|uniref:Uncharacterized protein n=1 Tax=Candidatus Nitrospira allomarina TaxID=3020900 RepID=A0AA96G8G6_9BACT|nr:hypothetical protein [Candidatus Nitrospira allomarina]WNM57339.1 hypothetical protein PP769_15375 [Candidatus Nitrospira allomarina]
MKQRHCAQVIMAILIFGLAPIHARAEAIVIGTVSKSPLSGSAPGGTSTLDVKTLAPDAFATTSANQWALGGLVFYERSDEACYIGTLRTSLNGRHTAESTSNKATRPPCTGKNVHDKQTIKFDKADHVVQAIQVCTTDKKKQDDKIKGAEIWAVRVGQDGTLFDASLSDKFRRPNCKRWREKVSCPSDQIAIGVEATWGDGGFAGLRLRCKAVAPME